MLFPQPIIDIIKECGHWADRLVRSELISQIIVTENDYTSNFTAAFRREVNSRSITGLKAHSQVLAPGVERLVGADACIVLMSNTEFKIGIFESKWPRLSVQLNGWDSIQKGSNISHFDSQLQRQQQYTKYYAIWEMFYLEEPFGSRPSEFPQYGSSCVWHGNAVQVSQGRNKNQVWTDVELLSLLSLGHLSIEDIIQSICECTSGAAISNERLHGFVAELGFPGEVLIISYSEQTQQNFST